MKDVPCLNDEHLQIGTKLCELVKQHPCLYDPLSPGYQVRQTVAAAWKQIGKDCSETAANCRFRWKTIRTSFTRSFRKHGTSSQYYLYEHLDFLIPHMSIMDRNDDSIGQADDNNSSQLEKDDDVIKLEDPLYQDSDTTKSAEETSKSNGESDKNRQPEQQNEDKDVEIDQNGRISTDSSLHAASQDVREEQIVEARPSRTRKTPKRIYEPDPSPEPPREKRPRRKSVGGLVLREYMQQNNISLCDNDDDGPHIPTSVITPEGVADLADIRHERKSLSPHVRLFTKPTAVPQDHQPEEVMTGRSSHSNQSFKAPSYEFANVSDPRIQKYPQRIVKRRQSLGGLALREYIQQQNIDVDEEEDVICIEPEIPQPPAQVVVQSFDSSFELRPQQQNKSDVGVGAIATEGRSDKPSKMDMSTLTDWVFPTEEKAIQCEEVPRSLDDEFLETLRPQIKIMNFRQKINFKQRVYLALMDVLDDAKNFPTYDEDVVELPVPLAKHFESATNGELRLMRELVAMVQAAKMSSEVVNANNKTTVVATPSPTHTTPTKISVCNGNDLLSPVANGSDESPQTSKEDPPTPRPDLINVRSTDSLGIPRHILHKAVKVTGNSGGTLMAQSGDRKRIYRIFPKNPTGPSATAATTTVEKLSPTTGTFFVTPPKPLLKVNTSSGPVTIQQLPANKTPAPPPIIRGTAIQYPKIIKTTPTPTTTPTSTPTTTPISSPATSSPMPPPNSNRLPNTSNGLNGSSSLNTTPQGQKISISTHVPSANIFRRRYSICGPAPSGTSSPITPPTKVVPLANKAFTGPPPPTMVQNLQPKNMIHQQLRLKQQALMQQPSSKVQHQPIKIPQSSLLQKQLQQQQLHQKLQQIQSQHMQLQQRFLHQNSQKQNANLPPTTNNNNSNNSNTSTQFQISKPISLNSGSEQSSSKSPTLSPNNNDIFEGIPPPTSPSQQQQQEVDDPLSGDIPILETAGTIAADSYESEFPKPPYIKLELDD